MQTIPLVDVRAEYEPLIPRLEAAFREVLDGKGFIRGPHYWAFQDEAASYLGVKRAIGVANGTDALVLALDALGVGPGDEVICPAFTFFATAESVVRRGATPVFADIDPVTLNLDLEDAAAKVTDRTRAIIPVHLFGRLMDVRPLVELGVPVLEDAAQAFGAPGVAQHGAISTFSFYPTKNLFCLGDGGLVVTSDEELADRVQLLSFHGSRDKSAFDLVGYNSRLDELQAAFLRIFLPELDGWNAGRRAAAARYAELGLGELVEVPQDEPGHVYHLFVCRIDPVSATAIRAALTRSGNRVGDVLGTTPLHLQPSLRVPRLRAGLAARDRARRCRELLAPALAGDAGRGAGARRRDGARRRRRRRAGLGHAPPAVAAPALAQLLGDAAIVAAAWWLAFELRFDHGLPLKYGQLFNRTIFLVLAIKLVVFIAFGLYNRWWRYISIRDMWAAVRAVVVASLVADLTVYLVSPVHGFRLPRTIALTDLILTLMFIAGSRLLARTVMERPGLTMVARGKEVIVVGAGDAGRLMVQEMQRSAAPGVHADRVHRR